MGSIDWFKEKNYRKIPYVMGNSMVSCRSSLQPIEPSVFPLGFHHGVTTNKFSWNPMGFGFVMFVAHVALAEQLKNSWIHHPKKGQSGSAVLRPPVLGSKPCRCIVTYLRPRGNQSQLWRKKPLIFFVESPQTPLFGAELRSCVRCRSWVIPGWCQHWTMRRASEPFRM